MNSISLESQDSVLESENKPGKQQDYQETVGEGQMGQQNVREGDQMMN